jgi:hypothetical protein
MSEANTNFCDGATIVCRACGSPVYVETCGLNACQYVVASVCQRCGARYPLECPIHRPGGTGMSVEEHRARRAGRAGRAGMIVPGPFPGQREPSCIHDSNQPASMCRVCQLDPAVIAWHEASREYAAKRAQEAQG